MNDDRSAEIGPTGGKRQGDKRQKNNADDRTSRDDQNRVGCIVRFLFNENILAGVQRRPKKDQ